MCRDKRCRYSSSLAVPRNRSAVGGISPKFFGSERSAPVGRGDGAGGAGAGCAFTADAGSADEAIGSDDGAGTTAAAAVAALGFVFRRFLRSSGCRGRGFAAMDRRCGGELSKRSKRALSSAISPWNHVSNDFGAELCPLCFWRSFVFGICRMRFSSAGRLVRAKENLRAATRVKCTPERDRV